jgi:hypothetical protein
MQLAKAYAIVWGVLHRVPDSIKEYILEFLEKNLWEYNFREACCGDANGYDSFQQFLSSDKGRAPFHFCWSRDSYMMDEDHPHDVLTINFGATDANIKVSERDQPRVRKYLQSRALFVNLLDIKVPKTKKRKCENP